MSDALTEEQVIRALRRLEARWPTSLILFGGPHSLTLLRRTEYAAPQRVQGEIPAAAIVAHFAIPADGGDPSWQVEPPANDPHE